MVLTIVTMTQGWFVAQTWYDASSTIVFLVNRREVEIMLAWGTLCPAELIATNWSKTTPVDHVASLK